MVLGSNPGSARFLPLAKAGPEGGLDAAAGTEVELGVAGAEKGQDDPWGSNVKYSWTQPGGEEVELSATDVARPTFTAPASADGTTLTFQLKVQGEGHGGAQIYTATDTVEVRIGSAGMAPMPVSATVDGATLTLTYNEDLKATNPTASGAAPVYLAIVDGVDGLRLIRPTSVTASGRTVTMTLAPAVRFGQTVTLSYYPDDATPESRVQDTDGIEARGFTGLAVRNATSEGPAGGKVDFTRHVEDGQTYTYKIDEKIEVALTFSEPVAVTGMPYLELEVGVETRRAVWKTGPAGTVQTFSYTVAEGDADRDGVAVVQDSLALDGGTILTVADDVAVILRNDALSHAAHRVDGVRPTAISARVAGPDLTVTFSEPLDRDSAPAAGAGGFAVAIDGGENPAVTVVSVSGRTVTLALYPPVPDGTTGVTVSYAPPAADPLRDIAGNPAQATPGVAVTVRRDTRDPELLAQPLGAAVRGAVLTLTYDEPLEPGTPTPLSSHAVYEVVAGGANLAVSGIKVGVGMGGNRVTMTLDPPVTPGQAVSVSYYPALATETSRVRDRAGREAEELLGEPVVNETPEGPSVETTAFRGAAQTYKIGDEIEIGIEFSEDVVVTGTPRLALDIGGATRPAAYTSGTGSNTLLFVYTVAENDEDADGVTVATNGLTLNGGTIVTTGGETVILGHGPETDPAHTVDGVRPTAASATAAGPTLTVTWSEALDGMSAQTGPGRFTVRFGTGTAPKVTAIAIDGVTMTLSLDSPIPNGTANVTLEYRKSSGAKIRDAVGNDADSFTGLAVRVEADMRAPKVTGATVDGTTLAVNFDEPLDGNSIPPARGGFTVTVTHGGSPAPGDYTVSGLSLSSDGRVLSLTLSKAVRGGDVVTLAYAKPSSNPLQDRADPPNPVAGFSGRTVDNRTPSVEAVAFRGGPQGYAIGEAIAVEVTFTEAVTVSGKPELSIEVGANTRKAVYEDGTGTDRLLFVYTVAGNDEDGAGVAIAAGALAAPPGSILTQTGNREVQLGHDAVAADPARVVDTVLPKATAAEAKGLTIEVTWSEALDETSAPAGTGGFPRGETRLSTLDRDHALHRRLRRSGQFPAYGWRADTCFLRRP